MEKQKLIIIAGPTAVGKSGAAAALAREIGGEVISADSMQVYRGMDIGTAKVTPEETLGVPHHLIDVISPFEDYNVVRFQSMAKEAIRQVAERGHVPILCGGTGFYIQALIYDIDFTEEPASEKDNAFRRELLWEAEKRGPEGAAFLHQRLQAVDPEAAEKIPMNNLKRVIRALEFYQLHGERISEHNRRQEARKADSPYDLRFFVLTDDRGALYERIDKRVDLMVQNGLVREVRGLMEAGVPRESTAMQGIGYREIYAALLGECSLPEAIEQIKRNSRHYAKRQLTWFRREPSVIWIDRSKTEDVLNELRKYL